MFDTKPFGTFKPVGPVAQIIKVTRRASNAWLSKRLALLLRRVALKLLRGAPVDIDALGARMRLMPYNNVCEKRVLFTPQLFDPLEREILAERIRDGFIFIDIGANVGTYSLFVAARAGKGARILAVEPQPDIYDRLVFNIRQNPGTAIKAVDCAVADKPGEATLFLNPHNCGESSLKIIGSSQAGTIKVTATTLLALIESEGLDRVDALKLDVEGAEDIILEPFLRDAPPELYPQIIIVEDGSERWQIDLPQLLGTCGYVEVARSRLNLIYERSG
ncbi:MAG: FkbM family methyltransferase [Salinarimonas sp.]|nr:FkbM family methyltransferase [Salinarimonas sp.]